MLSVGRWYFFSTYKPLHTPTEGCYVRGQTLPSPAEIVPATSMPHIQKPVKPTYFTVQYDRHTHSRRTVVTLYRQEELVGKAWEQGRGVEGCLVEEDCGHSPFFC